MTCRLSVIPFGLVLLLSVAACGDPLAKVDKLSEIELDPAATPVGAIARADQPGVLTEARQGMARDQPAAEPVAVDASEPPAAKPRKRGFFGFFAEPEPAVLPDEPQSDVVETAVDATQPESTETAVLQSVAPDEYQRSTAPRRGLLGLFAGGGVGTTSRAVARGGVSIDIQPGTLLPFGNVGRVCGLSRGDLGQEVAGYPERGKKYRLYDSEPGNAGPHTFHITGFDDRCPRQVTAALGLFGDVAMHETLAYGASSAGQGAGATDAAYEKVKSRVCGAGRGKPCGARISRLQKSTVFLTLYERFGDNSRWSNLLIHEGQVVAQDIEGN